MWFLPIIWKISFMIAAATSLGWSTVEDSSDDDPAWETSRNGHLQAQPQTPGDWTCIVPYFNEAGTISRCLTSLAQQTHQPLVILVDNASTDASRAVAEQCCADHGLAFVSLSERRPGKVSALATGLAHTTTGLVATCDADTFYPPDYLARAAALLRRDSSVAAGAVIITSPEAVLRSWFQRNHRWLASTAAPWQCHAGGAGQVFQTQALRQVGGFCPKRWNYVLEDHEVIARLTAIGQIAYDTNFWCSPLDRPDRHAKVGWTLAERVCYHMTTRRSMPAYFDSFLAPRLLQRQLWNSRLRPTDIV